MLTKAHVYLLLLYFGTIGALTPQYKWNEDVGASCKLHYVPANWHEARLRCQYEGGILASTLKPSNLATMMNEFSVERVFLGIHATFSKGDYYSIDGTPLDSIAVEWAPNEPDNYLDSESCLAMYSNGSVADVKCSHVLPYICCKDSDGSSDPYTQRLLDSKQIVYKCNKNIGSCYKFHLIGKTWSRAFMTCAAESSHLAIINSREEAIFLKDLLRTVPVKLMTADHKDFAYIGFLSWGEPGAWTTIHGQSLQDAGFLEWGAGQPDNSTVFREDGENCGSLTDKGNFNDVSCEKYLTFICEEKISDQPERTEAVTEAEHLNSSLDTNNTVDICDENVGSCYTFHLVGTTWPGAFKTCAEESSHLAIINSQEEADVIQQLLLSVPITSMIAEHKDFAYIGFQTFGEPGEWMTIYGQTLVDAGFIKWGPGQPDNSTVFRKDGENCGSFTDKGNFNDVSCGKILTFICEKEQRIVAESNIATKPILLDSKETQYTCNLNIGSCYSLHLNKKTWPQAFKICASESRNLAVINSHSEAIFLKELLQSAPDGMLTAGAHIGFQTFGEPREWTTVFGQSLTAAEFYKWMPGQPDSSSTFKIDGKYCGSFTDQGSYSAVACEQKLAYICEDKIRSTTYEEKVTETVTSTQSSVYFAQDEYKCDDNIGSCYKFHYDTQTWPQALKTCREESSHLAIINSQEEANFIKGLLLSIPIELMSMDPKNAHIGFQTFGEPGEWITLHGQSINEAGFSEWELGHPDSSKVFRVNGKYCGSFTNQGRLNDVSCEKKINFICEKQNITDALTLNPAIMMKSQHIQYACDENIGSCYKFHLVGKTWPRAFKMCAEESSHLAIINSYEEAKFLKELILSVPVDSMTADHKEFAHIGFQNFGEPGNWMTIRGESLEDAGFLEWATTQPDNSTVFRANGENCGSFTNQGNFNDVSCEKTLTYICEKEGTRKKNLDDDKHSMTKIQWDTVKKGEVHKCNDSLGSCYKYHLDGKTWPRAFKTCEEESSHLAIINTQEEANFLKELLLSVPISAMTADHKEFAHIGFQTFGEPGDWITLRGQSLEDAGFLKWETGPPDNSTYFRPNGEHCGSFTKHGGFNDVACEKVLTFICEKKMIKNKVMLSRTPAVIEMVTEYICDKEIGSCYNLHLDGKTWPQAFKTCAKDSGHLAIINSKEEADYLKDIFRSVPHILMTADHKDFAYIGFQTFGVPGDWMTLDGQPLNETGFMKWEFTQPDNSTVFRADGENCGSLTENGEFNDVSCGKILTFFCEKELNKFKVWE